ncbi:hypothetical protein CAPTEDRAFT_130839, partial [Capitella teleta]
ELIELQCDDGLRGKFRITTPLQFWSSLAASGTFPALVSGVLHITSLFGSTYACEQLFSKMKTTKSKTRSELSDQRLTDVLLLSSTKIEPNLDDLCGRYQHQSLH